MPLWFVPREGEVWIWTYAKSQKVRNLERDPRATVLVETGHEYGELRGAMIEAEAVIHRDFETVLGFAEELTVRYAEGISSVEGDARAALEAQAPKRVAIQLPAAAHGDLGPPQARRHLLNRHLPNRPDRYLSRLDETTPPRTSRARRPRCWPSSSAARPARRSRCPRPPKGFFGIVPQTPRRPRGLPLHEGRRDRKHPPHPALGRRSSRTPRSPYDWSGFDAALEVATRAGLRVLPSIGSPPHWAVAQGNDDAGRHRPSSATPGPPSSAPRSPATDPAANSGTKPAAIGPNYEPAIANPMPIREWQIWNEANFFYFAYPVSTSTLREAGDDLQPGDQIGRPEGQSDPRRALRRTDRERQRKGWPATTFLAAALPTSPASRAASTGSTSTPTRSTAKNWKDDRGIHAVARENHDRAGALPDRARLGLAEQLPAGRLRAGDPRPGEAAARPPTRYLLENARRLNLKPVYWFSWKDLPGSCTFCDSVGLFRAGPKFQAKPSWHAFVAITGGRARP